MKKFTLSIFIFVLSLCSCVNFTDSMTVDFINNTNCDISIISLKNRFSGTMDSLTEIIEIKSGETVTTNIPFMGESFSAEILYDNQKYLVKDGYIDWVSKFSIQFELSDENELEGKCFLTSDYNDCKTQVLSLSKFEL